MLELENIELTTGLSGSRSESRQRFDLKRDAVPPDQFGAPAQFNAKLHPQAPLPVSEVTLQLPRMIFAEPAEVAAAKRRRRKDTDWMNWSG